MIPWKQGKMQVSCEHVIYVERLLVDSEREEFAARTANVYSAYSNCSKNLKLKRV